MTYDEAIEATVTRAEARAEIARHDLGEPDPWALFIAECGDHPTYPGATVLGWLGY